MYACVGVCAWACTRCMLTVIAAGRCIHVLERVFWFCIRCKLIVIAAGRCMRVGECVFGRVLTVLRARLCMYVSVFVFLINNLLSV